MAEEGEYFWKTIGKGKGIPLQLEECRKFRKNARRTRNCLMRPIASINPYIMGLNKNLLKKIPTNSY